ncbi:MAG: hypothetical protein ABI083_10980 [Lapillicoccus sp.]
MMIVLLSFWLVGWCLARLVLRVAPPATTPTLRYAPLKQRRAGPSRPLGLEDDPRRWPPPPVRGEWTALDERQLTRLLTDSAAIPPPVGDSP